MWKQETRRSKRLKRSPLSGHFQFSHHLQYLTNKHSTMPKSPASMLYGGGARDSSESEEDSSSTGWSDKDDSSSIDSSDRSSEEADPLPPPASSPKPATPPSPAKKKESQQKKIQVSPKDGPQKSPLSDVEPLPKSTTSDTKGMDVAPTMPPNRSSESADMYKRVDSDDESSSSGDDQNDAPHVSDNTSSHNQVSTSVGDASVSESNESHSPKKRSFMGLFGKTPPRNTEQESSEEAGVPCIGAESAEAPLEFSENATQGQVSPARRSIFGRVRRSKDKRSEVAKSLGTSDDPNVTADELELAQDEEVEFESAPNANSSSKSTAPDPPVDESTRSKKQRFWFGNSRNRSREGAQEEPDIEHGDSAAEYNQQDSERRDVLSPRSVTGGGLRLTLIVCLGIILFAGVAFGAAYGGFTLANQNKNSGSPAIAPAPTPTAPPGAVRGPCAGDDILLDLAIQFDAQPERASIELKDYKSVNSAIWSFPAGSFRSFTQLRRQNFFQICLNPLPSYELSILSLNGTGMISEFARTRIYGSWVLSYNESMVASYSGDCNVTNATFCGAYSSCSFILSTNSTYGNCSAASSPPQVTQAPGETPPPSTNTSSSTLAPTSQMPTTPAMSASPVTQAPSLPGTTAVPGTSLPSVPGTTIPPQSTSQPTIPGSTLPPQTNTLSPQ